MSKLFPRGLPTCRESALPRVREGNKFLDFAIKLIKACTKARVPFALEHPQTSYMWHDARLQAALRAAGAELFVIHQCQFGTPHRKPTTIAVGVNQNLDYGALGLAPCTTCIGRHGYCSRTGKKHVRL